MEPKLLFEFFNNEVEVYSNNVLLRTHQEVSNGRARGKKRAGVENY